MAMCVHMAPPTAIGRAPTTAADWDYEFTRYRASPEFALLNPNMTLQEFKTIYWMEWTHRLWGRVIGITFLLPTLYFIARRKVSARMSLQLVGICAGIGVQVNGANRWLPRSAPNLYGSSPTRRA